MAKPATSAARQHKRKVWRIEVEANGKWLWVILPDFKTKESAEAHAATMRHRDPLCPVRVVEG